MNLFVLKYLFPLVFDGEKTSRELAELAGDQIYNASHAMIILHKLKLVRHPQNRVRSWEVVPEMKLNLLLEKLLFVSQNNDDIKNLLQKPSIIKIGSKLYKSKGGTTISVLVASAQISKTTVLSVLSKFVELKILQKSAGKPYIYHISKTTLAQLFFEVCRAIQKVFALTSKTGVSPEQIIKNLEKDKSVLILIHYGSASRGKGDLFSDIDLLAVTRDKICRGNILSNYSHKQIDLSVYSKSGFLKLLKTHPDFINNISQAKVLKGKEILQSVIQYDH